MFYYPYLVGSAVVAICTVLFHCPMCPEPAIFSLQSFCRPCGYKCMFFDIIIALNLFHFVFIWTYYKHKLSVTCWPSTEFLVSVCWTITLTELGSPGPMEVDLICRRVRIISLSVMIFLTDLILPSAWQLLWWLYVDDLPYPMVCFMMNILNLYTIKLVPASDIIFAS